ncbi:hypothetical protein [Pseudomonas maioricensis]|nr:hypothetical protein [Pseudomonas sp. S25]
MPMEIGSVSFQAQYAWGLLAISADGPMYKGSAGWFGEKKGDWFVGG